MSTGDRNALTHQRRLASAESAAKDQSTEELLRDSEAPRLASVTVTSITPVTEAQARASLTSELDTFGKGHLSYYTGCDYYRLTIRPNAHGDESDPIVLRFRGQPSPVSHDFSGATIERGMVRYRDGLIMGRAYTSGQTLIVQVPRWQEDT